MRNRLKILQKLSEERDLADLNFERCKNKEFNYGRSTGLQWAINLINKDVVYTEGVKE